jgi:hypothetical protein
MTGPEHLRAGKALLVKAADTHEGMLRAGIAAEAQAHLTAALVIAQVAALLPDRLSWQEAGDA